MIKQLIRPILSYLIIWLACVLWFWLGMGGGGWIMAYTILSFSLILPITTLIIAFRLERRQDLRVWRWIALAFFSIMYMAALWATFVLSTFLKVTNISTPAPISFLFGLCPGIVGIALGWMVRTRKVTAKIPAIGLVILLCVCYVWLKSLNGSVLRFIPVLDIPALIVVLAGLWYLCRKKQNTSGKDISGSGENL